MSVGQLERAGLGRHAVAHGAQTGWLRPLHRGVYLVGPLETEHSRAMAATLAAGPGALLSHYPAAVLWGLRPAPRVRSTSRSPGARPATATASASTEPPCTPPTRPPATGSPSPHRPARSSTSPRPPPPATSTERPTKPESSASSQTIPSMSSSAVTHATEAPQHSKKRNGPSHSSPAQKPRGPRSTSSAGPAARAGDQRASPRLRSRSLWRAQRLVVEIDGYAFHSSRRSFERDRRKDQHLQTHGYRVIRITWRQLTEEPEAVVATITRALAERW